jgi:hypothetical protein
MSLRYSRNIEDNPEVDFHDMILEIFKGKHDREREREGWLLETRILVII